VLALLLEPTEIALVLLPGKVGRVMVRQKHGTGLGLAFDAPLTPLAWHGPAWVKRVAA
jgi:hypothetical protein